MDFLRRFPVLDVRSPDDAQKGAFVLDRFEAPYEIVGNVRRHRLSINGVMLDGLSIAALRSSGHVSRTIDMDAIMLIAAEHGRFVTQSAGASLEVQEGAAALCWPNERTTTFQGPYLGLGLRVPVSRLATHAARNGEDRWRPGGTWPRHPSPRLVRALRYVVREFDAEDALAPTSRAVRGMGQLLLDMMVEEMPAAAAVAPPVSLAGLAEVRRAEEALRARATEAVSIVALAGELGISTRALQLGFRRHRGMTPRAFLAACRYERTRERLLRAAPEETVTSIALDCGVSHLGRFAAAYRARYGEAPSTTLARCQGRT